MSTVEKWHDICRKAFNTEADADASIVRFLEISRTSADIILFKKLEGGFNLVTPMRLEHLKLVTGKLPLQDSETPYLEVMYVAEIEAKS